MTRVFSFLAVFALFAVIVAAKTSNGETAKASKTPPPATEFPTESQEEQILQKKHVPVEKMILKQNKRHKKMNQEAEMGRVPGEAPQKTPQQQNPKDVKQTIKVLQFFFSHRKFPEDKFKRQS